MKTLIVSLLLLSFNIGAETIPLPPSVSNVDDIVNEFRNPLVTKIGELGKNFISLLSDKTILFTSSLPLKCIGYTHSIGQPVSNMQYSFKKSGNELVEKSTYVGCNSSITLVEDVSTRGGKLEPLKYSDFIKGKRDFELKYDETYRYYRLSNGENDEIFKMVMQRTEKTKTVELFILGQNFLRMNYEFQKNSTKLVLTYLGFKAKYARKYSTWETENNFDSFMNSVLVTKNDANTNTVTYLNNLGVPLSQNEYLSHFGQFAINGPLSLIRKIVEYHNYYFPSTEALQTGSVNEHLKEELRILYNRLQNNTELHLVKRQIQEYIDAAENGLILDKRPKQ